MIGYAILLLFTQWILAALSLLPHATPVPSSVLDSWILYASYLEKINHFLPVSTVLEIMILVVIIESGITIFKILNFVINKVRGSGG